MRLLIVNADDFGLNAASNAGILQAHRAGAVTSTTLMVNGAAASDAAALAKAHPALGVGLHFNLTWGRPVAPPQSVPALLASDGGFLPREKLVLRLLAGRIPAAQIRTELAAQLARLRDLGLQPSHIDSHQHVHGFGPVFDAVAMACVERGIAMRVPWVHGGAGQGLLRRARRTLLARVLAPAVARWRGQVAWNDGIGSVFDLGVSADAVQPDDYRRLLAQAGGSGYELMVHPVTDAEAMHGYTRIGALGAAEWRCLCGLDMQALAAEAGFRLGSYRDLPSIR